MAEIRKAREPAFYSFRFAVVPFCSTRILFVRGRGRGNAEFDVFPPLPRRNNAMRGGRIYSYADQNARRRKNHAREMAGAGSADRKCGGRKNRGDCLRGNVCERTDERIYVFVQSDGGKTGKRKRRRIAATTKRKITENSGEKKQKRHGIMPFFSRKRLILCKVYNQKREICSFFLLCFLRKGGKIIV